MRWTRYVGILVLLFPLLATCARVPPVSRLQLPEPRLPACLVEGPPATGEAVGRYEFAPAFLARVEQFVADGIAGGAAQASLECASETARTLRQAVTAIRLNNAP